MDSAKHSSALPTLLRTKLHRPRLGTDLIQRSHLLERLNQGFQRRATLVSAPAGFGKTTPLGYLTTTPINEIADLPEAFLLVLDDYHLIDHQDVHQLVYALMQQYPPPMHLVITTRQGPLSGQVSTPAARRNPQASQRRG